VLAPLVMVLSETVSIHLKEVQWSGQSKGSFTWEHWKGLLFDSEYNYSWVNFYLPLLNSIGMGLLACLFAILIGGVTAFLMTRTNIPGKKFISAVFIFPYIMPSWSIAMFWENFFKNTVTGTFGSKGMLQMLTGAIAPDWMVYGIFPCAIALAIHYAPFAYILIGGVLRNMDSNLEEAAQILGVKRPKIISSITIPLVLPAIISTVLLVFASSISSYTVPLMLGMKGDFWTLSIKMKALLDGQFPGQGYAMTVVLILISVAILLFNQAMTGKRKSYVTVSGKSSQISKIQMHPVGKWITAVILIAFVSFFSILPMISFALESFLGISGDLSSFTFDFWISKVPLDKAVPGSEGLFFNPLFYQSIGTSLLVSIIVAFIAGTFGVLIGYGVTRRRDSKMSTIATMLAFIPYLIPAMAFGVIYLAVSLSPPLIGWLYGSLAVVILCGSIKFLPFASRGGTSAMLQISGEIEESAIVLGVPWWKRMLRIIFPIQKSSIISGYLLPFISCMRELSLFVLLIGNNVLMTSLLANYQTKGLSQMANGLNLVIVILVLLINFGVNKLTGASIDKGVGSSK
jgi:iron(III) transport system permease protein